MSDLLEGMSKWALEAAPGGPAYATLFWIFMIALLAALLGLISTLRKRPTTEEFRAERVYAIVQDLQIKFDTTLNRIETAQTRLTEHLQRLEQRLAQIESGDEFLDDSGRPVRGEKKNSS